jgi:hypothetical protein
MARPEGHVCAADLAKISKDKATTPPPGQLVDRYGNLHTEGVLRNWSPAALKALGIRRVGGEP